MSSRAGYYPQFFVLAGLSFIVLTLVLDVIARAAFGGEPIFSAAWQHLYYAVTGPIGTMVLLLPFALLAWISGALANRNDFRHGLIMFGVGVALLAILYFVGYHDSAIAIAQRKWTAASLAVGLLPFESLPIILVVSVVYFIARRPISPKPSTSLERTRGP